LIHPGIHFKAVEGDTLPSDTELSQGRADIPVKAVAVHAQVGRGVAEADQSGLDLHRLSPNVNRSNLFPDMTQLFADSQAGLPIPLSLGLTEYSFGWATLMGRWPAGEFPIALLGIGMAQAVHFR
jgi:hypothetical protein